MSDFVDSTPPERRYDQLNTGALQYDYEFERRFRFTPIEHLPVPGQWKPQPSNKLQRNKRTN